MRDYSNSAHPPFNRTLSASPIPHLSQSRSQKPSARSGQSLSLSLSPLSLSLSPGCVSFTLDTPEKVGREGCRLPAKSEQATCAGFSPRGRAGKSPGLLAAASPSLCLSSFFSVCAVGSLRLSPFCLPVERDGGRRASKSGSADQEKSRREADFSGAPNTQVLAGKVALITGGASGMGKATSAEFIREGAKVVLADVQQDLGRAAAAELGPDATFVGCDVTVESQVSAAVDFAVAAHGRLDVVYNNAGVFGPLPPSILDLDLAGFDRIMAVNVRGVVAGIKHAARVMVPRRSGCILCTASIAGVTGGSAHPGYAISKFAVAGAVRSAAAELCGHGVRVNAISPSLVMTPMTVKAFREMMPGADDGQVAEAVQRRGALKGAVCEAEDVAKAAVYLASEDAQYVSGHNLVVDGGFTAFKPSRFGLLRL